MTGMSADSLALLIAATLNAGTVVGLASLGLLINERAGVLNLGAEGMMLCAAIAGFAAVAHTGQDSLGFLAGMAAGGVLALRRGGEPVLKRNFPTRSNLVTSSCSASAHIEVQTSQNLG